MMIKKKKTLYESQAARMDQKITCEMCSAATTLAQRET
jgi:DNA-binding MltR family transcriptional regulator